MVAKLKIAEGACKERLDESWGLMGGRCFHVPRVNGDRPVVHGLNHLVIHFSPCLRG